MNFFKSIWKGFCSIFIFIWKFLIRYDSVYPRRYHGIATLPLSKEETDKYENNLSFKTGKELKVNDKKFEENKSDEKK